MTKPPSPQAVIPALKRAGFSRSQSSGVYHRTNGYAVRKCRTQPDAVEVRYWPDSREVSTRDVIEKRRTLMLLRYADALLAAGFRSQKHGDRLIVYGRTR